MTELNIILDEEPAVATPTPIREEPRDSSIVVNAGVTISEEEYQELVARELNVVGDTEG